MLRALELAVHSLLAWKLRSLLTISAVGLAVTALTIIVATMEGAARKAEEIAVKFGPTAVNVVGGDLEALRPAMTLTWKDKRALEAHLPEVERVSPYLYEEKSLSVRGNGKNHIANALAGSGEEHWLHWSWPLSSGRDFTVEDVHHARRVCFLGHKTAKILFGDSEPVGATVFVENIPFLVVGIHSPLGLTSGDVDLDDRVTVPITTMARCFNYSREHLLQFRVTFPLNTPEDAMSDRVETVRAILRESHGLLPADPDDFLAFTAGDILAFVSILKGGVGLFLGITVVAASVVSGFVLANLFHLAVAERQEEIGLKKALGASRSSILLQFMLEALLLCVAGALAGLLAGIFISGILQRYELLNIALSGFLFMTAFAGACCIGLCFALSPARRAADMQPVAALRRGA